MNIFLIAISVAIFVALITLVIMMVALFKLSSMYKKQINIIEENKITAEYEQQDNDAKDATEHQLSIARLNNHKKSTYEYMLDEAGYYVKNDVGDFIIISETVDGYDDTLMDK